jgi:predicted PurR-regulated permease PerM
MISLACAIALLYFGRLFFVTLLVAVIIAFILEPLVSFITRFRLPRPFASFIVCSFGLLLLYLAGLGAYTQLSVFSLDLPAYSQRIGQISDIVLARFEGFEKAAYQLVVPRRIQERERQMREQQQQKQQQEKLAEAARTQKGRRRPVDPPLPTSPPPVQEVRIQSEGSALLNYLVDNFKQFYDIFLMASFLPFLVYFMLSWRDHIRHGFLMLFTGENRTQAKHTLQSIANISRAYVVGNFILGFLLSFATCLFLYSVRVPYWLLAGVLSGFLSLVPYIGLPLAVIPPFFAALTVHSNISAYLIVGTAIAFLHLLALNLLYPKLVGSRVHLNPLVVTVALMFWATLWGGVGLVLAIPLTAGIKAVCDSVPSLEAYGRLLGD